MKGWPDYVRTTGLVENYDEFAQNYPVGIGDGAARLGSIKTYDMRGRVWWMDDFEAAVLKWETSNFGVGGSQALNTAHARNGNQSVKLVTNTGGVRNSSIHHAFQRPQRIRIGIEASIELPQDCGSIEIFQSIYDGTNWSRAAVRINENTNTIEYYNDAGGWTDTGFTWNEPNIPRHFSTVKIVSNYLSDEYIRILYNYQELDLTGVPLWTTPWLATPYMNIAINAIGDGVNNVPVYVDDVILTAMEPK